MKRLTAGFCLLALFQIHCIFASAQQRKKKPRRAAATTATRATVQDAEKPLANADIVRLSKAGLADAVIIKVIEAGKSNFDLSVDNLIRLKTAGVSQAVIQAMQNSSAASADGTRQQSPQNSSLPANSAPLPTVSNAAQQRQPFVVLIEQGSGERQMMPSAAAQIVETKTKGNDLASIARDEAVADALGAVAADAAAKTEAATASMPVLGAIISGGIKLGGMLRRKPHIAYVAALGGQSSALRTKTAVPKFEIGFGGVDGVNPDEFEPVILRLTPAPNNWRLVSARKAKLNQSAADVKFYTDYEEDRVPIKTIKIERGRFQIEPETALPAGEYAVVLRPVAQNRTFSMNDQNDKAAFALTQLIWDFTVK